MTESSVKASPSDVVLAWISARGRASTGAVDRACRVIAERFDSTDFGERSTRHGYVQALRRIGHVEDVADGLAVVPATLCWTARLGHGMFIGARDEDLRKELPTRLGSRFVESHPDYPWPETWGVHGERASIESALAGLEIDVVDEPGMRLLASLPTLEDAIAKWSDSDRPTGRWEYLAAPAWGTWKPSDDVWVEDGLIRTLERRRRAWVILRGGVARRLDTPERRAVAWWSELARLGSPEVIRYEKSGLQLPRCSLPPPSMVERPLIWASGGPPENEWARTPNSRGQRKSLEFSESRSKQRTHRERPDRRGQRVTIALPQIFGKLAAAPARGLVGRAGQVARFRRDLVPRPARRTRRTLP